MKKQEVQSILDIGREYLQQWPNAPVCQIADVCGLETFSKLLTNENLMGKVFVFPRRGTLKKVIKRVKIESRLKHLKSGSPAFKLRLKELAKQYGTYPSCILAEYNVLLRRKKKK